MSLQQILKSETTYIIHEHDEYIPLNKSEILNFVHTFTVKLRKEEIMGIEMFVVDIGLNFPVPKPRIYGPLLLPSSIPSSVLSSEKAKVDQPEL
jgi:hypothetical protein